eukprot:EG_transcript_33765
MMMSNAGCPFRNPMDCPFYNSNELSHTHTGLHVTGLAADSSMAFSSKHPLGTGLEENYRLKQEVERLKYALQQSNGRLEKLETRRGSKAPPMAPAAAVEWEAAARAALAQAEADVRDRLAAHLRSVTQASRAAAHARQQAAAARTAELSAAERRLAEREAALAARERHLAEAEAAA